MTYETLDIDLEDGIGRLTLARPDKLNALDPTLLHELIAAAEWFDSHDDARVVVVSGRGRAFSAGFDLAAFSDGRGGGTETSHLGHLAVDAIESMRAVTVAAVHGHCIGGGVVLLTACDIRIAADDASFMIPEVDLGIPLTWGGVPRLVREIGPAATRDLVMTCRTVPAEEALHLGLVSRVVAAGDLAAEATATASELAEKAPYPLHSTKQQVAAATRAWPTSAGALDDSGLIAASLADPKSVDAARRYLERRR